MAKKVVTPPLKTIKPMWIELLGFHLAEIGMIWTRDCSPTKSDNNLGQTFNARSSGIVELRNHSIGGRSPKSIFTLWQLWINICIFFQKFFWLFEQCPVQPLWVLGMRCLHLPVRALSKVLLLPVWVWLVLPSTAYSKGMLPLDLWCQASLQGLPERQHLGKTLHCWGWSDRIVSWVLGPWRRGWDICTEWGLVAQRLTTDSCPVVTGHIDPQGSPCWLPTTVVSDRLEWAAAALMRPIPPEAGHYRDKSAHPMDARMHPKGVRGPCCVR